MQVILHYSDQGSGKYASDPGWGKKRKLQTTDIYEWEGEIRVQNYSRYQADFVGLVLTPKSTVGNTDRNFAPLMLVPDNTALSEFSFSLFIDIHDWTEDKHNCKLFSDAAESPDAKDTCSCLSAF